MQRSIDIFIGSVLSTMGLTVPAMLVGSKPTGHPIELASNMPFLVLLLLTLAVFVVTFAGGCANGLRC